MKRSTQMSRPSRSLIPTAGDHRRSSNGRSLSARPRSSMLSSTTGSRSHSMDNKMRNKNTDLMFLMEFLQKNNYPHTLTISALKNLNSKIFYEIFLFLYKVALPDFEFVGRREDAVITALKEIGYPVKVTKNQLYMLGSQMSAPIFAMLSWLCRLYTKTQFLTAHDILDMHEDKKEVDINQYRLIYLQNIYQNSLNNDKNDKNQTVANKIKNLLRTVLSPDTNKEQIQEEFEAIRKTNESIDIEEKSMEKMRAHCEDIFEQRNLIEESINAYTSKINMITSKQNEARKEKQLFKEEIAQYTKEVGDYRRDDSEDDIEKITNKLAEKRSTLKTMMENNDRLEADKFTKSKTVSKNRIQEKFDSLNSLLADVTEHLSSANSDPFQIEIIADKDVETMKLNDLVVEFKEKISSIESDLIQQDVVITEAKKELGDYKVELYEREKKIELLNKKKNTVVKSDNIVILDREIQTKSDYLERKNRDLQQQTKELEETKLLMVNRENQLSELCQFVCSKFHEHKMKLKKGLSEYIVFSNTVVGKGISK